MPTVTVHDPRHLDGEPHDVARVAGETLEEVLGLAQEAAENLSWAARGAWMSAEEHRTGKMPDGSDFPQSVQGTKILALYEELQRLQKEARVLALAVGWNPRSNL